MRAKIVSVDHFGYCGRDYHPEDSDIGTTVTLVGLDTEVFGEDGAFLGMADQYLDEAVMAAVHNDDRTVRVWTAITPDGRPLELVEHEIEMVS